MKVIVPYARNRICYAIVKSLSKLPNVRVYAADSTRLAMSRWSTHIRGSLTYPSSPIRFRTWCEQKLEEGYIIFPTFMESWYLEECGLIDSVPPYETIRLANNKLEVHKLCKALNIPTPDTRPIDYPSVIKRIDGRGAIGRAYYDHGYILQRRVGGDAVGVGMLFNKGEPRAKFAWRRIEEFPEDGGMSVIRESIRAPEQERDAEKLLRALRWHGVAMVEYVGNHVIEVNPRFWGSLQLAIDSGVDFPKLLLQVITEGDCEEVLNWEVGVKTSWLAGCLRRGCRPQGHIEDLSLTDPIPFLMQFAMVFANLTQGNGLVLDAEGG